MHGTNPSVSWWAWGGRVCQNGHFCGRSTRRTGSIALDPTPGARDTPAPMRIVQRYIFFELLKVFGLALSVLTLLFILGGLIREAQEQGLKPAQVVQIV